MSDKTPPPAIAKAMDSKAPERVTVGTPAVAAKVQVPATPSRVRVMQDVPEHMSTMIGSAPKPVTPHNVLTDGPPPNVQAAREKIARTRASLLQLIKSLGATSAELTSLLTEVDSSEETKALVTLDGLNAARLREISSQILSLSTALSPAAP